MSQHMFGLAVDIRVDNHDPATLIAVAKACGATGIGTYPKQGFIHVDVARNGETGARRPARWGKSFPPREPGNRFDQEADRKVGGADADLDAGTTVGAGGAAVAAGAGALGQLSAVQDQAQAAGGIADAVQRYGLGALIGVFAIVGVGFWLYAKRGWLKLWWRRLFG